MSKVSHLPKTIPSKEIPFKFKGKGAVTQHKYEGDFVVSVPGGREMSRIGIELAKINDGIPLEMLDRSTASLNNAIAYLRVALKTGPAWFINSAADEQEEGIDFGMDTVDVNIPIDIFMQANAAVQGWYKSLKGQPKDDTKSE